MFGMENYSFGSANAASASAPAVSRVASILDLVAESPSTLGVSEIARRSGVSKSTAHAIITGLIREGFLDKLDSRTGYSLGPRLARLATRAQHQRVLAVSQACMDTLSLEAGQTALFGEVQSDRVTIMARRESRGSLNLSAPVGSSIPVLAGALGKAYLGALDADLAHAFLLTHQAAQHTERSITSISTLESEAALARRRGYALERGEYLSGVAAAAAAISTSRDGYLVWLVGIEANFTDEQLQSAGECIGNVAREIQRLLSEDGEVAIERKSS